MLLKLWDFAHESRTTALDYSPGDYNAKAKKIPDSIKCPGFLIMYFLNF